MRTSGKNAVLWSACVALTAAALWLAATSVARAADRVYWGASNGLAFANLDGSGGGAVDTGNLAVHFAEGIAIDPVDGRIYWVDRIGNDPNIKLLYANLDGSGGGELSTAGATFHDAYGLALDPVGRRVYWTNLNSSKISYANLDGSGGGNLALAGKPTPSGGIAVDPATRHLYWINLSPPSLGAVNLDGTDVQTFSTVGAEVAEPFGIAIDPTHERVYWSNVGGAERISYANLDGSGGGILNTSGATVQFPFGVAVDPVAGRVYWANRVLFESTISYANLDGSGHGGSIPTKLSGTGDPSIGGVAEPMFPVLVASPSSTAPPAISGGSASGSTLSCSPGGWAPDKVGSLFYEAPRSYVFQWSRDGTDLPGATQRALTAKAAGEYRCRVTAQGVVGTTSAATSDPHRVSPGFGKDAGLALGLASRRVPARGPIAVRIANSNPFAVSGDLTGRSAGHLAAAHGRPVKLAPVKFAVGAGAKTTVKLRLPGPLRALLARRRKLPLALTATAADPGGARRTVEKTVVPKLRA